MHDKNSKMRMITNGGLLHYCYSNINEGKKDIFACSNCRHRDLYENFYNDNVNYKCPMCGAILYKRYELNANSFLGLGTCVPNVIFLFNNDTKLNVSIMLDSFYYNTKVDKIAKQRYNLKLVINKISGQSYVLPIYKQAKNGTFVKFERNKNVYSFTNHICNVSYGGMFSLSAISDLLDNIIDQQINKAIKNELGFGSIEHITYTLAANKIPYFRQNPDILSSFARNFKRIIDDNSKSQCFCPKKYTYELRKIIKGKSVEEQMINFARLFNIPITPKYKALLSNPAALIIISDLMFLGFKDINVISSLCNHLLNLDFKKYHVNRDCLSRANIDLLTNIMAEKGEVWLAQKIIKNDDFLSSMLFDTVRLYYKIKDYDKTIITRTMMKGNLKTLHDNFSKAFNLIKYKNISLLYTEKELALEDTINMDNNIVKFKMAKDTDELVKIGQQMKICVGSYRDKCINKFCDIISIMYNNNYVGCIELKDKNEFFNLIQAKAPCNNRIQGFVAKALKQWCEKHKIYTNNCYDYTHIKDNNIDMSCINDTYSTTDYHNLEIVNGQVTELNNMFW